MTEKELLSKVRQAITYYQMINANDKIAIGLSGGKDSMTLAYALKKLQSFYPVDYSLTALFVDSGLESNANAISVMNDFCYRLKLNFEVIKTDIYKIVFEPEQQSKEVKNPCALCSKLRRGALTDFLTLHNYNKLSFAHHKDDLIETYFLSMLYEGRLNTFLPVTYWEAMAFR